MVMRLTAYCVCVVSKSHEISASRSWLCSVYPAMPMGKRGLDWMMRALSQALSEEVW